MICFIPIREECKRMTKDWTDFKAQNGGFAGARDAFEKACETIYRKKHKDDHVGQVLVRQGDGGIDIFIGELGVKPITVIQCKFFLDTFEDSQKDQIRNSFKTAIFSKEYVLKEWILCLPRSIDIKENSWWFKWKHKKLLEFSQDDSFIKLTDGNALIDLSKELDLYNDIFDIKDSIMLKAIYDKVVPTTVCLPITDDKVQISDVLFNNYISKNEPYYIPREEDSKFNKSLEINNIWLFGKSGVGKTALINRNLMQNSIEFCFCDLSPVTITKANDVLEEILFTIEEKFTVDRNTDELNIVKQITQLLCKTASRYTVIVIDELSVEDETLREIAISLIQLVSHYGNNSNENRLKFVVSTILDPKKIIKNKSKASDHFQYICCDSWSEYASHLFDILCDSLRLEIDASKELIISSSNNSPRIMKLIFKKLIVHGHSSDELIEKCVKLTLEEIVE